MPPEIRVLYLDGKKAEDEGEEEGEEDEFGNS
jgi:hypothetical protein